MYRHEWRFYRINTGIRFSLAIVRLKSRDWRPTIILCARLGDDCSNSKVKIGNIGDESMKYFTRCKVDVSLLWNWKKKKEMIRYTSLNQKVKRKKEEKKTFRCLTSETSEINFL